LKQNKFVIRFLHKKCIFQCNWIDPYPSRCGFNQITVRIESIRPMKWIH